MLYFKRDLRGEILMAIKGLGSLTGFFGPVFCQKK